MKTSLGNHLMVPENRTGSCGIMESLERRVFNGTSIMFTPSSRIFPSHICTALKRLSDSEDLPLPVRPQIPTYKLIYDIDIDNEYLAAHFLFKAQKSIFITVSDRV